ncbi:pre-16S rRNA-processing nuclease YqgF [Cyanobacterium aponinum UTEX 3222]|uniref:Resolvase RNase H domain protein fold protein n=2 Tax=Cyanobacterium aponinum TaxID=379064 RepID=K9Z378_CYAAP|nr:pre-16S rRNA-processing nuclease YqgF [Cyanobacterium aponinum]AFZ53661.1 Resolvase RNase H domain protein fold protein [Cyanobacterium aponinum PCC 10605]WPF89662.1 pre-16S rRNA-processing nuclease YqgF [Cyanobacterium aponinum AL20115]WRL41439.1 pre-16S rRNA-processing nuclease YqgF [Cyanobacterium aponinum UTEX 3222]
MIFLGFDPGRDKCGLAIVTIDKQILWHEVIKSEDAIASIQQLWSKYQPNKLIIGNLTTSQEWKQKIIDKLNLSSAIEFVDEKNSTLEARGLYWQMYPPKGLGRLIPQSLKVPPRPIDDLVAILLVERYIDKLT